MKVPEKIIVIENIKNDMISIQEKDEPFRSILFENIENSNIIINSKMIKISFIWCQNCNIKINFNILGTFDIFKCYNINIIEKKEIPLICIEHSNNIKIWSKTDLQILNSFSQHIFIIWSINNIVEMPLILFSQHWMWKIPYKTNFNEWQRFEISFLIQDNILHL